MTHTAIFYAERNHYYSLLSPARLVLNLGCGSGSFLRYWPYVSSAFIVNIDNGYEEHAGWPAWGIENKGWEGFKKLSSSFGNVKNIDGDVRNLNIFPSNLFDLIVAGEILEHISLSDADVALEEWIRVLVPSGIIQIDTPNFDALKEMKDYVTDHVHEYKEDELRKLMKAHKGIENKFKILHNGFGFWGEWRFFK